MKLSSAGRIAIGLSLLVLGAYALAMPPLGGYHLLKKYALGGGDGKTEYFDYLTFDPATRRLYVSHGTEMRVINADTGADLGTISDLKQMHGIALVPSLGKGFISDGGNNRVVIFDLKTLKATGEIKTGGNPDCIIYDPASKHIFTFNGNTKNSTVIDPAKEAVVGTVEMGGRPEYAVADGKGMIYDNIEDKNEVVALDSRALTIKARWPIAPAGEATAMGMDRTHRRLFVGGRNPKMLVIMNAETGKVIQSFPIGDGVDANVFEPKSGLLYVSTREGTLHIFHEDSPDKFTPLEDVKTEFWAKTMALDPKTQNAFLSTADFGPPPAPTADNPHPNPKGIPGTFHVLVFGR